MADITKKDVEKICREEFKKFLNTTQSHEIILNVLKKELNYKKIDDKIIDLSSKVIVELFKTIWTRKSFWENQIKNVK